VSKIYHSQQRLRRSFSTHWPGRAKKRLAVNLWWREILSFQQP